MKKFHVSIIVSVLLASLFIACPTDPKDNGGLKTASVAPVAVDVAKLPKSGANRMFSPDDDFEEILAALLEDPILGELLESLEEIEGFAGTFSRAIARQEVDFSEEFVNDILELLGKFESVVDEEGNVSPFDIDEKLSYKNKTIQDLIALNKLDLRIKASASTSDGEIIGENNLKDAAIALNLGLDVATNKAFEELESAIRGLATKLNLDFNLIASGTGPNGPETLGVSYAIKGAFGASICVELEDEKVGGRFVLSFESALTNKSIDFNALCDGEDPDAILQVIGKPSLKILLDVYDDDGKKENLFTVNSIDEFMDLMDE
jgi:hypothetical protein